VAHEKQVKYVLQDYDRILIVASWGMPKHYKSSRYVLEVEAIKGSEERRCTIGGEDAEKHYSSTTAIRNLLWGKINVDMDKIDLLIFCQDTVLIDRVKKRIERFIEGREWKRSELKGELLSELYEQKPDVARELDVRNHNDYERFVRFVPGVITSVEGAYLYTWRSERCYDLLLGSIILHTYKKLKEISESARRMAILIDTTHGVNYFVTALKEGVLKAVTLYAFDKLVESIGSGNPEALEELSVYHYNSDPLTSESEGTPSLKIHLLDETSIVKNKYFMPSNVLAAIEGYVAREGLSKLSDRLNKLWGGVEWKKVLEALLLLSRGLLVWALRIARNIKDTPSISDLEESLNELRLKLSSKGTPRETKYEINYSANGRNPVAQVIEYAILMNALKTLVDGVACTNEVRRKGSKMIEEICKGLCSELTNIKLQRELQNTVKNQDDYMCFNLEKLEKAAEQIYTSPYRDIISNEIRNIKDYLEEREVRWKKINEHVYEHPKRPAYMIEYDNTRILISATDNIDERTAYAHAGLAYGLPWSALSLKEEGIIILYLGKPEKLLQLLHETV